MHEFESAIEILLLFVPVLLAYGLAFSAIEDLFDTPRKKILLATTFVAILASAWSTSHFAFLPF